MRADNRPSGFDYLRLSLAVSVLVYHSIAVSYGSEAAARFLEGPWRPLAIFIVPSFFALSGFLVAGSLERNTIPAFLTLRALRIFPALTVEVMISALLIGPLLTVIPWPDYFTNGEFYAYFLNVIGNIHYTLPGVFANQPPPNMVNAQLWTVPYELDCYIAITVLALARLIKPARLLLAVTALMLMFTVRDLYFTAPVALAQKQPGPMLVVAFLFGVLLYLARSMIPSSGLLAAASAVLSWVLLDFAQTIYLAAIPVAYLTAYLGVQDPRRFSVIRGADYSYGIYLYSYPIQQSVAFLLPSTKTWFFNTAISLPLSAIAAYLSWTLLEFKIHQRRKAVLSAVSNIGRRRARA